jgi:hypothetical protein
VADLERFVEICLPSSKFSGFPQNMRVYDEFPISQPESKEETAGGVGVEPL